MTTVFISYAHGSEQNASRVRDLVAHFRRHGVDVLWDQDATITMGLADWMSRSLRVADWIVVICDDLYARRLLGADARQPGRGVAFEYSQIRRRLYLQRCVNTNIVPVGFGPYDERRIPDELQDTPYYDVSDLQGLDELTAVLKTAPQRVELLGDNITAGEREFERSFSSDIAILQQLSDAALNRLSGRQSFIVDGRSVSLPRSEVDTLARADARATLLIGEPGSGKSAVIASSASQLVQRGATVIILDVDALEEAENSHDLRRRLGLRHEIPTILANWPAAREKVLFVDALDVARSSSAARTYRDLILRVAGDAPTWRIVASVRRYEFEHGHQLREVFRRLAAADASEELSVVKLGALTSEHLSEVAAIYDRFAELLNSANARTRELISNPFNLSLCAAVLQTARKYDLYHVQTQYDLLALYWESRIYESHVDASDALKTIAELMMRYRSTAVHTEEIGYKGAVEALLSNGVLVEADYRDRADIQRVRFRHALLLDYSVERLFFRGRADGTAHTLADASDAVLLLHPAVRLHFQAAWAERSTFWRDARVLEESSAPSVAKTIAPTVAAEMMQNVSDLLDVLSVPNVNLVRRFVRAAERFALNTPTAQAKWLALAAFLEHLWSGAMNTRSAFDLLWSLYRTLKTATVEARISFAATARSMLAYAFRHRDEAGAEWYVRTAIESVCETFDTDPQASAVSLAPLLSVDYLQSYGYADARWLSWHFSSIYKSNAHFAVNVYRSFFHYHEYDSTTTHISSGVMAMTSNRRQDYDAALYALGESFEKFAASDLIAATEALGEAIVGWAQRDGGRTFFPRLGSECRFLGQTFFLPSDGSQFWDGPNSLDPSVARRMLKGFQDVLTRELESEAFDVLPVLHVASAYWRTPSPWRRLLMVGAEQPERVGSYLFDLVIQSEVLTHPDLSEAAACCAAAIEPFLNKSQRRQLLDSLRSLRESRTDLVSRIAALFRPGSLPTEWAAVPAAMQPAPIEPMFQQVSVDDLVALSRGAKKQSDPRIPNAVKVAEPYYQPQGAYADGNLNAAIAALRTLLEALDSASADDSNRDFGWSMASAVAHRLAENHLHEVDAEAYRLIRSTLLRASHERLPEPNAAMNEQFERSQSWGTPSARIDAALGLFPFALQGDTEALERISEMAQDERADVRYLVITNAPRLPQDLAWQIAAKAASDDNLGVLAGFVSFTLPHLWNSDEARASEILFDVFSVASKREPDTSRDFREGALSLIEWLAITRNDQRAANIVRDILYKPGSESDFSTLIFLMSRHLEAIIEKEPYDEYMARTIAEYFSRALSCATERSLERVYSGEAGYEQSLRADGKLVHELAQRLYFASGAFEHPSGESRTSASPRFYQLVHPLLSVLAKWPIPGVLHHVVLILDRYLIMDPRGAFLIFADAIVTGDKLAFQFDPLAFNPIANFVERCLAEYHELLESDDELRRALVAVTNVLADAGIDRFQDVITTLDALYR